MPIPTKNAALLTDGPINCLVLFDIDQIPARLVLYIISTTGFIVNYMMRNDINIAILAMVQTSQKPKLTNTTGQNCYGFINQTGAVNQVVDYGGTLEWSPEVQSYVLSTFFWAYVFSQCAGGAAIQRYGSKRVFGYAQLVTALTNLCIPWASKTHYGMVILCKIVQGFACGFTWPAIYGMVAHWIPLSERSRFITCFQGYNVGTGISFVLGGFLIANLGWESVFYTTGSIGLAWCVLWYLLAFDSPEEHPRISFSEKQYLRKNTVTNLSKRERKIPWKSILLSGPVWSLSITGFGRVWIVFTFIIYGPQYMKDVLGFDIKTNGVLSGAPYVLCFITALMFSYIGDMIISRKVLSTLSTRKTFTGLSQILSGVICILIGYIGCNITAILVTWFVAIIAIQASYAGAIPNTVDLAPNFAGPVGGFSQTILMIGGMISPLVAGYLVGDGSTLLAWQKIFNIAGSIDIITCSVFLIWGQAEIQPWDQPDETPNSSELHPMTSNNRCQRDNRTDLEVNIL